jgi:hypothetical protein
LNRLSVFPRTALRVLFTVAIFSVVCGVTSQAAAQVSVNVLSPSTVIYGVSPSTSVTIFGSGFQLGSTITVGSVSGTTVAGSTATATTPFVFVSSTRLAFYWTNTALTPTSHNVQVTNSPTDSETLPGGFTVQPPQPSVSSTSPSPVTYGITANSSITIFGSSFVVGATITVGSLTGTTVTGTTATAGTPYVYVSATQLKFYWPNTSLSPGPHDVQVANPVISGGLSAVLVDGFSVAAPQPSVSSLSPASVTYAITTSAAVTIFGSNFQSGATIRIGTASGACNLPTCVSGTTVSGSSATAGVRFVFVSSTRLSFYWLNT